MKDNDLAGAEIGELLSSGPASHHIKPQSSAHTGLGLLLEQAIILSMNISKI